MNVTVTGNLCADPELRHTPGNVPVADLRIAENRYSKDPDGEWRTDTSFFAVVCWRDLATHAAESLHRGDRVVAVGRLRQDTWTTDTGEKRSRYVIDADDLAASIRFAKVEVTKTSRSQEPEGPVTYDPDDPARPFE
ncbi:MAG: single-stranded DNA-binding protein [Acidimicrobiia bacterium]